MKFCGLISGGKDSIYAIQIATQTYGHTLVCGAHISPAILVAAGEEEEEEELDSYMYQTVASNVVPTIGVECLGVPMVIHTTRGKTSNTRLMYDYASRDKRDNQDNDEDDDDDDKEEVEDLYTLLDYMKQLYPEVTAVSCGAILSTYQRTRFEHVCSRLSLIPLAFLWRRAPQASLLREMLQLNQNEDHIHNQPPNATPMQAIVVKTASMGLSSRHLNRNLLELLPHLQTMESKYGLHVCGEGGEYESLVLDCTIYRKRLILDQVQIMYPNKDDMDPSTAPAYLKIIKFHTENKKMEVRDNMATENCREYPPIHYVPTEPRQLKEEAHTTKEPIRAANDSAITVAICPGFHSHHGGLIQISQLISTHLELSNCLSSSTDDHWSNQCELAVHEFQNIIRQLNTILIQVNCTPKDVVMVHLYLSSMGLFTLINKHYVAFFGSVLPPSRVCIAVGPSLLLGGRNVAMDCTVQYQSGNLLRGYRCAESGNNYSSMTITADTHLREVLHVQSRSCWAPSCVGPYSQANTLREGVIYLAGQIGLIPSSMELSSTYTWEEEFHQCWTNVAAVLDSMGDPSTNTGGQIQTQALGGIVYISSRVTSQDDKNDHYTLNYKAEVWNTLQQLSHEAIRNNAGIIPGEIDGYTLAMQRQLQQDAYEDEETRLAVEASQKLTTTTTTQDDPIHFRVPLLFVAVPELPVGARSEVELICISSKAANCLKLHTTTFSTKPSMIRPKVSTNTDIDYWLGGCTTNVSPSTVNDDDTLEITTTMRYVTGCCAVACIHVVNHTQKVSKGQRDRQLHNSSVFNLDLVVREVMNHILQVARITELFLPTHLSRVRLHFSPDAGCGDGTLLQGAIQTELTRLVVTEQQRQKDTTGIGDQNISIPALSIVPVEEISENGVFAVLVELVDLLHMETELWVKHNRIY